MGYDLVAERLHQPVAVRRGDAAEIGHDLTALQGVEQRRPLQEQRVEAVEIWPAGLEVILEALAAPRRAGHMLDEPERPGAQHIAGGKCRVLLELGGAVYAIERI